MFKYLLDRNRELQSRRADEGFDGFTLIELLIVIVVIAILAATVIFALSGVSSSSAQAACNSDAKSVEVAVEAYHNDPANAPGWPTAGSAATLAPTYLRAAPTNTHYAITLGAGGDVLVTPSGGTAASYDGASNPCTLVK